LSPLDLPPPPLRFFFEDPPSPHPYPPSSRPMISFFFEVAGALLVGATPPLGGCPPSNARPPSDPVASSFFSTSLVDTFMRKRIPELRVLLPSFLLEGVVDPLHALQVLFFRLRPGNCCPSSWSPIGFRDRETVARSVLYPIEHVRSLLTYSRLSLRRSGFFFFRPARAVTFSLTQSTRRAFSILLHLLDDSVPHPPPH